MKSRKLSPAQLRVKERWRVKNPDYVSPNYNKNKEMARNRHYLKRYGISLEHYNTLLQNQNNECKICKTKNGTHNKRLAVDHCHKTGGIRGLLCLNCNQGLGKFKDNIELLDVAREYLNVFEKSRS
jgi:hypothetical protein